MIRAASSKLRRSLVVKVQTKQQPLIGHASTLTTIRPIIGVGISFNDGYIIHNTTGNQKRFQSNNADKFEQTMDELFNEQKQQLQQQQAPSGKQDEWFVDDAVTTTVTDWTPTWYNLADHAVTGVQWVHNVTGLEYGVSIVAITCALRCLVLPMAIRGQRAASRMAHLQPELQQIKQRYEALGTPSQAEQRQFANQMQALFKKYDVSPFSTMAVPFIQAPLFISMFFGMKKMPELFPTELSTGGMFWFVDLTVPDPTYILPLTCGVSFLATIETGKEQMIVGNPQYGHIIVNVFRALAVVMVPVMTTFPSAMLCYWVPNNIFTLFQSTLLHNPWVKKQFGIWDRPKPVPGQQKDAGFQETFSNLVKQAQGKPTTEKELMKRHNEEIETKKKLAQMSKVTRERRRSGTTSRKPKSR